MREVNKVSNDLLQSLPRQKLTKEQQELIRLGEQAKKQGLLTPATGERKGDKGNSGRKGDSKGKKGDAEAKAKAKPAAKPQNAGDVQPPPKAVAERPKVDKKTLPCMFNSKFNKGTCSKSAEECTYNHNLDYDTQEDFDKSRASMDASLKKRSESRERFKAKKKEASSANRAFSPAPGGE